MHKTNIEDIVSALKASGITEIVDHSGKCSPQNAFFCQKYGTQDGQKYLEQASNLGCNITISIGKKNCISIEDPFDTVSQYLGFNDLTVIKSLYEIHKPSSVESLAQSREYLATLEYIAYKHMIMQINKGKVRPLVCNQSIDTKTIFGFELTQSQKDAIRYINQYQQSQDGRLFLLQGDVGSGKTAVAIMAAIHAVSSGVQTAVLAPTQILATQLYHTFNEALSKMQITCTLIVSKEPASQKRKKLEEIKNGTVNIIIGTHAIFSENVVYKDLGFIIIDEQHKFGVNQRLNLMRKSNEAKCLLMTATPIPRTLAMSMYSGIEYFSMTEKPKNRLPIKTTIFTDQKIPDLIKSIQKKFGNKYKMYWVCPLIEEESAGKSNIKERQKFLQQYFAENEILTVHGKMKEDAINSTILRFKDDAEAKVLLSTSIVEVGINIPSANIIVIESADTFGLASLHQLRGRVGRNNEQGYCMLLYNHEGVSESARTRLEIMRESTDGFEIAEMDRKMRGSGNILGINQSGAMKFVFFNEEERYNQISHMNNIFEKLTFRQKEIISSLFESGFTLDKESIL